MDHLVTWEGRTKLEVLLVNPPKILTFGQVVWCK